MKFHKYYNKKRKLIFAVLAGNKLEGFMRNSLLAGLLLLCSIGIYANPNLGSDIVLDLDNASTFFYRDYNIVLGLPYDLSN